MTESNARLAVVGILLTFTVVAAVSVERAIIAMASVGL